MKIISSIFLLCLFFLFSFVSFAQPPQQMVRVIVSPDHSDWIYKTGEKPVFTIEVFKFNNPLKDVKVKYELGIDMLSPSKSGTLDLSQGNQISVSEALNIPGFLRCKVVAEVEGKEYEGRATVGFSPLSIKPTVELPADFKAFWDQAKQDAQKIPIDAKITLMPERCTEAADVFHVSFQNASLGSRIYGILSIPKGEGKYPALLKVPGAGIRPYLGDQEKAAKGIITLEIGIHGIPVNMDKQVYDDLYAGALKNYMFFNADNRDKYYYKRVYLGCVRAIDFLFTLPKFNKKTLGVLGGSQGGALAVVTAGLDPRVNFLVSQFPALSDMTGYLHGRGGGWPHIFSKENASVYAKDEVIKTLSYYDVVNFARQVKVPGFYTWGFNDGVCPPVSTYSVYNSISAEKELYITPDTGHWTYPEQSALASQWIVSRLLK